MPVRYPEFGERVATAMKGRATVAQMSRKLKISYEMARRYTLGQAMPRNKKMTELAEMLGVTPFFLQFGTDENGNTPNRLRKVEVNGTAQSDLPSIDEVIVFMELLKRLNRADRADALSFMENLADLSAHADEVGAANDTQ